jgi:DNA-binding MarR family transcriptional regulator
MVTRTPHPTDGRQVVIELTDAAEQLLLDEARAREAWLAGRLQQLSPEERAVLRDAAVIMDKLASG